MNGALPRIYLSSPHMGGEELSYIHDAFKKNWIAPLGENVDEFEKSLQAYTGRKYAAVVTSGTAAIHLALRICGVEQGDEVVCQSFTFAATANPILYQGASPVFVDSEFDTWNMDPELLEQAILDRRAHGKLPKAIILVHLYGMPAKVQEILKVAEKYNIPVIEDAAEALGSAVGEQRCGTFGKLSVLSFNGNKIITTSGGGALLGDDNELIKKARFLATQAKDKAPHYQHSILGYNYRMSNIAAGIGRGQMKVINERVAARRANHDFYFNALEGNWIATNSNDNNEFEEGTTRSGIYFLKEPEGYFSNRWLTTILVNPDETEGVTRQSIQLMLEKRNIECRPLWKPMHLQPLYKDSVFYGNGVSNRLFRDGLCLPSGSNMSDEDRLRVVTAIRDALNVTRKHLPAR